MGSYEDIDLDSLSTLSLSPSPSPEVSPVSTPFVGAQLTGPWFESPELSPPPFMEHTGSLTQVPPLDLNQTRFPSESTRATAGVNVDRFGSGSMPRQRAKKAATLRPSDWEPFKERIIELHTDQKKSLKVVRDTITRETGFIATERQYKTIYSHWKLARNIKPSEMKAAVRKLRHREVFEPEKKPLKCAIRGELVSTDRFRQWNNRHNGSPVLSTAPSTPSAVHCWTASDRGTPTPGPPPPRVMPPSLSELDSTFGHSQHDQAVTPEFPEDLDNFATFFGEETFDLQPEFTIADDPFGLSPDEPVMMELDILHKSFNVPDGLHACSPSPTEPATAAVQSWILPMAEGRETNIQTGGQLSNEMPLIYGQRIKLLVKEAQDHLDRGNFEIAGERLLKANDIVDETVEDRFALITLAWSSLGSTDANRLRRGKGAVLYSRAFALISLSTHYAEQSRHAEAQEILTQIFSISSKIFGEEHPDTLLTMMCLSLVSNRLGGSPLCDRPAANIDGRKKQALNDERHDSSCSHGSTAARHQKHELWARARRLSAMRRSLPYRLSLYP